MTVYLVRRYENHLDEGQYGVDDNYYLVGIYATKKKAEYAASHLTENENPLLGLQIIGVEVDHTYPANLGPWLGGGSYIE